MRTDYCGQNLVSFLELESTNFSAKELAKVGYPSGTLVLCDHQISGRGRRGKNWISHPDEGICMSLILRPKISPQYAARYTIAVALGVCRAMNTFCVDAKIKWPNDIVVGRKKLSGILLECAASSSKLDYIIIGIGINVNTECFYGDLSETAVSIRQRTGVKIERERVIAEVINASELYFELCENDFDTLMTEYRSLSVVLNQEVSIIKSTETFNGVAYGFDEYGRIIVKFKDESSQIFDSGDVSLRTKQ
ncbi:MAG: biotin--[acetyl-CoA-carboxylase] ligase [Clostridia bacterium]